METTTAPIHLANLMSEKAKQYGDRPALHYRNDSSKTWIPISWNEVAKQVTLISKGLASIGLQENENIGIFSQNMCEIIIADLAIISNHAVSVPLYATSTTSQIDFIVKDAEISIMFVGEQYQYDVAMQVKKNSKFLKKIIVIDTTVDLKNDPDNMYFSDLLLLGQTSNNDDIIAERKAKASEKDLVNILYTSGTTGEPKGVMLHQYNYTGAIRIHKDRLAVVTDKDTSMCFLPITHIFERAWTYLCLERGVQVYVNKRPIDIQQTILEVKPTLMCTVPRYWEKVFAAITEKMETLSPTLKKIFTWAIQVGKEYNLNYYRYRKPAPLGLKLKYRIAEKLVFSKIKAAAGLDNMHFFPCAGSRLADEINEFMHSLGINVVYGYGLTESTATVSCYYPENKEYIIGSIGKIMPEVEVKISEQGEILLKGNTITAGYYKRPDANKESFIDGWFKTGDAGHIDEFNNLYITDRIKDLFKTAGGKYIAPQMLESRLSELKFIDQIAIIGNERKYVTALIVPTFETLKIYASNHTIEYQTIEELIAHPAIIQFYADSIKEQMKDVANYEQIKRFTLLPKPFTMEEGLLTNTLKLKRKEVARVFEKEIEKMYLD
jgi:long-chain acyl-CoA synthetase